MTSQRPPKDKELAFTQLWQRSLELIERTKSLENICNIQGNLKSIFANITGELKRVPGSSISTIISGSGAVEPATINHEMLGGLLGGADNDHQHLSTAEKANAATAYSWGNHAGLYRPIAYVPAWNEITDKPTTFTPSAHTHPWSDITTGKPTTLAGYGIADALASSLKGAINGVAELDATGKVPTSQLPSYVDDVIEAANFASLPGTGETGKIYVTLSDNKTYRWSGSAYVEISASLALGETSSTAYRGDRGKTAYDHSQVITGNPHGTVLTDLSTRNHSDLQNRNADTSYQHLTSTEKTNAATAYGWGNHGAAGYLKANGTVALTANWNVGAFKVGVNCNPIYDIDVNGAIAGVSLIIPKYSGLLSAGDGKILHNASYDRTLFQKYNGSAWVDALALSKDKIRAYLNTDFSGNINVIGEIQINGARKDANWDAAYSWGNHASASYLKADGTVALSADWSAGNTRKFTIGNIRGNSSVIVSNDWTYARSSASFRYLKMHNSSTGYDMVRMESDIGMISWYMKDGTTLKGYIGNESGVLKLKAATGATIQIDTPAGGLSITEAEGSNIVPNWNTAYTHSQATTGSVHGSTTIGGNLLRLTNPSAITFLRANADNTVSALSATDFRTAIGAGTSSLALGDLAANAYYGDKGKTAYDHSQVTTGAVHGATTVGNNLFRLTNPSAIRFIKINADNTVTARTAAEMLSDIGAQASGTYLKADASVALSADWNIGSYKLGIGRAPSTYHLEVAGNALIQGTAGFDAAGETAVAYLGNSSYGISATYGQRLSLFANSTNLLTGDTSGNVGFGGNENSSYKVKVTGKLQVTSDIENTGGVAYIRIPTGSSTPAGVPNSAGAMWFSTTDNYLAIHNGTTWVYVDLVA